MKLLLVLFSAVLLSACGDRQFSAYQIDGGNHSLSLTREREFVWDDWMTHLVVARFPDCQRRYLLKGVILDRLKVDVYRVSPGVFILNAGKRWYVTETSKCGFEQYKEPPPEPGEIVGSFQFKDDQLQYISEEEPASSRTAAKPRAGSARE